MSPRVYRNLDEIFAGEYEVWSTPSSQWFTPSPFLLAQGEELSSGSAA